MRRKGVAWQGRRMTFVPDDRDQPFFTIEETTQVEAVPYANTPPAGSKYYQWPPTNNDVKGAVGTGLTISPDDFAGMVGKPHISQIGQLVRIRARRRERQGDRDPALGDGPRGGAADVGLDTEDLYAAAELRPDASIVTSPNIADIMSETTQLGK
jgi:hypothetical protein